MLALPRTKSLCHQCKLRSVGYRRNTFKTKSPPVKSCSPTRSRGTTASNEDGPLVI